MQPLRFGKKRPTAQELALVKKEPTLRVESVSMPASDTLITPRGPRLNLLPIGNKVLVTSPDAGQEEPDLRGGIYVDKNTAASAYAVVDVLEVGPEVKPPVVKGGKVVVVRAHVQQAQIDGHAYWQVPADMVVGVVG